MLFYKIKHIIIKFFWCHGIIITRTEYHDNAKQHKQYYHKYYNIIIWCFWSFLFYCCFSFYSMKCSIEFVLSVLFHIGMKCACFCYCALQEEHQQQILWAVYNYISEVWYGCTEIQWRKRKISGWYHKKNLIFNLVLLSRNGTTSLELSIWN